jgi:5-methylcytosine-specific restriction protein B
MTATLTDRRIRTLSADELELAGHPQERPARESTSRARWLSGEPLPSPDEPLPLPENDPLLRTVKELLAYYGGVILTGPPGTGKSWSAQRLAITLAGSQNRVRSIQFHPSYQYEDFVQGYVPGEAGFQLKAKHLLEMAAEAGEQPEFIFVLVIDELSRGDAARIFGEGLTYVEKSKRGQEFSLASGERCTLPENLVFITTMNPLDRGVDDVDAAFERRFAKVPMDPDVGVLGEMLDRAGLSDPTRGRLIHFFVEMNRRAQAVPQTALGHTYFATAGSERALRRAWNHQLRFFFEKAYRLDPDGYREVCTAWDRVFSRSGSESESDVDEEYRGG